MAKVWFSVIILVLIYQVVAGRDCMNLDNIQNCDECIRCGAYWCNNPNERKHCSRGQKDDWCTGAQEELLYINMQEEPGTYFSIKNFLQTITVGRGDDLEVTFPLTNDKVELTVNSTQTFDYQVLNNTICNDDECTMTLKINSGINFCTKEGGAKEFISVKLNVKGVEEESIMNFHVPCACACSKSPQNISAMCNGRGTYTCGVCTCDEGWEGKFCEQERCEKRGDIPCSGGTCSGNGNCGRCDRCECFTDRPGSRYFIRDEYCAGICSTTNDCEDCFLNNTMMEPCHLCHFNLYRHPLNKTKMEEKDSLGRQLWVECNHTVQGCNIVYAAMEDDNNERYFMIISNSCDALAAGYVGTVNLTLPLVLGIGALVLAGLAAAGYAAWHRPTPDKCVTPDYQTVGSEGCTGENPLYRPPTSSFKNPTYGKL